MTVFVSYVRRENQRLKLEAIAKVASRLGRPYIDDLEDHHDDATRYATVTNAVRTADAFLCVVTEGYPKTQWTCWEFCVAKARGIPRFALLPDGLLVEPASPLWPWDEAEEAAYMRSTDVALTPPPPAGVLPASHHHNQA